MVVLVPEPVIVAPPGDRIRVQFPVDGNPDNIALPVDIEHVGCVIIPITGALGTAGCGSMTIFAEATEVHTVEVATV